MRYNYKNNAYAAQQMFYFYWITCLTFFNKHNTFLYYFDAVYFNTNATYDRALFYDNRFASINYSDTQIVLREIDLIYRAVFRRTKNGIG